MLFGFRYVFCSSKCLKEYHVFRGMDGKMMLSGILINQLCLLQLTLEIVESCIMLVQSTKLNVKYVYYPSTIWNLRMSVPPAQFSHIMNIVCECHSITFFVRTCACNVGHQTYLSVGLRNIFKN